MKNNLGNSAKEMSSKLELPQGAVTGRISLDPDDESPFDLSRFANGAIVYDMIYNPAETAFLRSARALGMRTANGLSMLVHQAARSLEIWTEAEVPRSTMFAAARKALKDKPETS